MGNTYSSNKEVRKLLKQLEAQGWTIRKTGGNHIAATSPDGSHTEYMASSPGGSGMKYTKHSLRKHGATLT